MSEAKPTVIITGIAGQIGVRLLPFFSAYDITGVDAVPPATDLPLRFESLDLAKEESCLQLTSIIQELKPVGVVHLAFDPNSPGHNRTDADSMWHSSVAGTARVMEAITEANRDVHIVEKFIFQSSALVYGPDISAPANEETPLAAADFPFALQQMEADHVVKQRAPALRGCSVFMLRPQLIAGPGLHNYLLDAFRGTPQGDGKRAQRLRNKGERISYVLPFGNDYLQKRKQFLHVDDLARLVAFILARTEPESQRLTLLNAAGRGDALTVEQCIQAANAALKRAPGKLGLEKVLEYRWNAGISSVAPEFLPYMIGDSLLNTDRLQKFLGADYENVIRNTNAEAFLDSFVSVKADSVQTALTEN
jgi:nucleoside-diphosphate-sugar epimerase